MHQDNSRPRLAIDIGGTFTDIALASGERLLGTGKVLTTHDDPASGALAGARDVAAVAGIAPADVSGVVHGTTLATNALIERRGARVACVLTEGFRDVLEIAYERRYSQYNIDIEKPDLIVPRRRCFTVPERVSVRGEVLRPLAEAALPELLAALDDARVDAVAVCLIHAYANPAHERRLAELLAAARPSLAISLSSEVSPEAREFDRLCTTVANAYVQPLMSRYLHRFRTSFLGAGVRAPVLMMTAGGGMTTLETAMRFPVRLVESGPAGGALLAARTAEALGEDEVLSLDIGGTTAKFCLIDGFRPQTARRFEIGRAERFVRGSGLPVRIPVIEMIEIGAGGGSIARLDGMGRLAVGPESAGSDPGPAAFGLGGAAPTVTDADIALGLIDPAWFAEGRLSIDAAAADRALEAVSRPLGLDLVAAAAGVSEIVDENMAGAARVHAVESGKDLGRRTMIAFGGNGPLHATRVARRAGVSRIVVPPDPGVGSAIGFLAAPVSFEIASSLHQQLGTLDLDAVNRLFARLVAKAEGVVRMAGDAPRLECARSAFMRYCGQGHEIEIALPVRALVETDIPLLTREFEAGYRRQFSRPVPGMEIEILNWAVRVATPSSKAPKVPPVTEYRWPEPEAHRTIWCDAAAARVEAAMHRRARLRPGDMLDGPALIVEPQTTTLVSTDWSAAVDGAGTLVLTREARR